MPPPKSSIFLLALVYISFISLGLPDGVLGVAWPAMRAALNQPVEAAGLVTMVLTSCAALSGFASGPVLRRFSAGQVVTASGAMTALALLGVSQVPTFTFLLLLAVPLGFGAGAVDSAMNHFVARHYSSRHMNWLHGFWGLGATLADAFETLAAMAIPGTGRDRFVLCGQGFPPGKNASGLVGLTLVETDLSFNLQFAG